MVRLFFVTLGAWMELLIEKPAQNSFHPRQREITDTSGTMGSMQWPLVIIIVLLPAEAGVQVPSERGTSVANALAIDPAVW